MNPVEIEEAVSALASAPFDRAEGHDARRPCARQWTDTDMHIGRPGQGQPYSSILPHRPRARTELRLGQSGVRASMDEIQR